MSLLFSLGAFASSASSAKPGMVLLTPTSIAHSGTSASIGANGQVTFTAVTSLSLNGVFSATYDNYMVSMRLTASTGSDIQYRLRAAGSDNSTANSYTLQTLYAESTTVAAGRATGTYGRIITAYGTQRAGTNVMFYGPYLAQPTASRNTGASDSASAYIVEYAVTHNQSTSYDGFTLVPSLSANITGALQVYGVRG